MRKTVGSFIASCSLFVLFIEMTYLVRTVDVQPIGPEGSSVGFASLNGYFFGLTGLNGSLYRLTGIVGAVPLLTAAGFALLGLFRLVKARSLRGIDPYILVLGGFYAAFAALYVFFEHFIINYRPVILEEGLEASYPSTHTMLAIFVMSSAVIMFNRLVENKTLLKVLNSLAVAVMLFIVAGRLASGVHWLTDIIAGTLLSSALSALFYSAVKWLDLRKTGYAVENGETGEEEKGYGDEDGGEYDCEEYDREETDEEEYAEEDYEDSEDIDEEEYAEEAYEDGENIDEEYEYEEDTDEEYAEEEYADEEYEEEIDEEYPDEEYTEEEETEE